MRTVIDIKSMTYKRRGELAYFEIVLSARTSKDCDPLSVFAQTVFEVPDDAHKIFFEAGSRRRMFSIGAAALSELLAHPRQKVVTAVLIHARVQVQTDYRRRSVFKLQQSLH